GALWRFWWIGVRADGLETVLGALEVQGGTDRSRAKASVAAVLAASNRFDFVGAIRYGEEAVECGERSGDRAVLARACCWVGWMRAGQDSERARQELERAVELAREVQDDVVLGDALNGLAAIEVGAGQVEA